MNESLPMSHVGYGVYNYPHARLEGWQAGRVEVGGHAESCIIEYGYWYPPALDRELIEKVFELAQHNPEARQALGEAIETVHAEFIGQNGWWRGKIYDYIDGGHND